MGLDTAPDPGALIESALAGPSKGVPRGAELEAAFGEDLGDVEVHAGGPQVEAALDAIDADAAAIGDTVLFRSANPEPESVAHEVAHVVQARRGGQPASGHSRPGDAAERDADQAAAAVKRGEAPQVDARPSGALQGGWFSSVTSAVSSAASTMASAVTSTVSSATSAVANAASAVVDVASSTANAVIDGGTALAHTAVDLPGAVVSGVAGTLADGATAVGSTLGGWAEGAADLAGTGLDMLTGGAAALASGGAKLLGGGLSQVANGVGGRLGGSVGEWISEAGGALGDGLSRGGISVGDLVKSTGVRVSGALRDLGDWAGASLTAGGLAVGDRFRSWGEWLSSGIDAKGKRVHSGIDRVSDFLDGGISAVREFFGLARTGNKFTGPIEIPDSKSEMTQNYSELGLPLTDQAWEMQNAIDGGKLQREYLRSIFPYLGESEILGDVLDGSGLDAGGLPASFEDLDEDQLEGLIGAAQSNGLSTHEFLDSLPSGEREALQVQVLDNYIALANASDDALFVLEMLPTDMTNMKGEVLESLGEWLEDGQAPDNFLSGDRVSDFRLVTLAMSEMSSGKDVFALPVPYSNTVSNIVSGTGVPSDGSANLDRYLSQLDGNVTTVASGYSQGGAAVLDYVDNYGAKGQLDYALALAPMGGADRGGGDGQWDGMRNGVSTLAISHQDDPANAIYGQSLLDLTPGALDFGTGDTWLHSDTCDAIQQEAWGDEDINQEHEYTSVPWLCTQEEDGRIESAGTAGYPTPSVSSQVEQLLRGRFDTDYQRRDDWHKDLFDGTYVPQYRPGFSPVPPNFS